MYEKIVFTFQVNCGASYAFASAGALEGAYSLTYDRDAEDLSEQNIIDCSGFFLSDIQCYSSLSATKFLAHKEQHKITFLFIHVHYLIQCLRGTMGAKEAICTILSCT